VPNNKFPMPVVGKDYNVFVVFCFGHDTSRTLQNSFNYFFLGLSSLEGVYRSIDIHKYYPYRRRDHLLHLKISMAPIMFVGLITDDKVIVNVNRGPEINFFDIVFLKIFFS